MTWTIDTGAQLRDGSRPQRRTSDPVYRFEGEFREVTPVGAFADGIRFLSRCEARIVTTTPGAPENTGGRVSMDVNGFVVPLGGASMPLRAAIAAPGFEFPDLDFRLTGSAYIRTSEPRHAQLDGAVVSIDGWVNFESGELELEARPL